MGEERDRLAREIVEAWFVRIAVRRIDGVATRADADELIDAIAEALARLDTLRGAPEAGEGARANEVCGQSATTLSLNMAPTRTGGCGNAVVYVRDLYRCADCSVPFHHQCIKRHFGQHEGAVERHDG